MMRRILDKTAGWRIAFFAFTQPFFNLLFKKRAIHTLALRSMLKLEEVEKLTGDIPILDYFASTPEIEKFNDHYGIASVIKQYAKLPANYYIRAHIDHAIGFNDHLFAAETKCPFPSIIMCGHYRGKVFENAKFEKKLFKIGPFIKYATPYLSGEDFQAEKKRLGRNLLVFPFHSVPMLKAKYDVDGLCKKILEIKKQRKFDNVRICLYWKDKDLANIYRKHGFAIVSAGHVFDPLFLPRLRSIIELSTMTMSNGIGTHLGYAISLGKSHYLMPQEITRDDPLHQFDKEFFERAEQITARLAKVLGVYSETVTKEQWEAANVFCGFDCVKTQEELNNILRIAR